MSVWYFKARCHDNDTRLACLVSGTAFNFQSAIKRWQYSNGDQQLGPKVFEQEVFCFTFAPVAAWIISTSAKQRTLQGSFVVISENYSLWVFPLDGGIPPVFAHKKTAGVMYAGIHPELTVSQV